MNQETRDARFYSVAKGIMELRVNIREYARICWNICEYTLEYAKRI